MGSSQEIAIIGAGSPIFTTEIFRDIVHTPGLYGSEVVLQDVNVERLNAIAEVCQRFAQELGVDIRVRQTLDRTGAVTDANFVINAALAGGKEGRTREKHAVLDATGIYGPIEAHAPYAQLRLMWDIALDIAKHSHPDATLIQAANPIPEGGTLIHRETGIKFIGVCQGYRDFDKILYQMGIRPELSQVKIAGINHNVWLTEFLYNGQDGYPRLDDWITHVSEHYYEYFLPHALSYDYQMTPVAVSLYRDFGLFPVGDTVRTQTPEIWWYHDSPETEAKWYGPTGGRESTQGAQKNNEMRNGNLTRIKQAASSKGSVRSVFPDKPGGQVVPIMDSIANDSPSVQQVNIANNGAISGLPDDLVVEIPALVDAKGVHSQGTITLPASVMIGALIPRSLQALRHVEAIQTGNDRLLVQQLMANHKVPNVETAEKILQIWKDLDPNMAAHYAKSPKPYTR